MSLIITSSKQQQYDGLVDAGVEKPYSYKNHMKSPLIVKKGSEIAVVSVRVDKGQNISVTRGDRMGLYWGEETVADDIITVESNLVCFLEVPPGTYTIQTFANALETQMTNLGRASFSNFRIAEVAVVTDAGDEYVSYKITLSQNASTTNISGELGSGSFVACVDSRNDTPVNEMVKIAYGVGPYQDTSDFTVAGNVITNAASDPLKTCCFISAKDYLSSTSGVCEFDFTNATGNIRVGLVRNMPKDRPAPSSFNQNGGGVAAPQKPNFANQGGNRIDEFYDYSFEIQRVPSVSTIPSAFIVSQSVCVDTPLTGEQNVQVPSASYTTAVVVGDFDTSKGTFFNKVRFTRFGEEIQIDLVDNKAGVTTLIQAGNGALKTCGQMCDLLYAKGEMLNGGNKLKIGNFDKGTGTSRGYEDERNYGFDLTPSTLPADGAILNAREAAEFQDNMTSFVCGTIPVSKGYSPADFGDAPLYSTINASGGQQRSWVVVLAPEEQYNTDEINGEMIPNDSMMRALGFSKSPLIESADKDATLSLTNDIVFKSDKKPEFSATESMFIRWNATQQVSYNGNMGSISKIVYACPRFDTRGGETGALYYEPYERVYVDCNNTEDFMITDYGVDIVDVNEKLVTSLTGDTQINFHIRQKEKFSLGRDSGRT